MVPTALQRLEYFPLDSELAICSRFDGIAPLFSFLNPLPISCPEGRFSVWILQKFFHPITIFCKHLSNIRFRPLCFTEPPDRVYRIFSSHLALVYPFNRAWQFRRIEPVKILCQKEPKLIAKSNRHPEVIQTPSGNSGQAQSCHHRVISAAQVWQTQLTSQYTRRIPSSAAQKEDWINASIGELSQANHRSLLPYG